MAIGKINGVAIATGGGGGGTDSISFSNTSFFNNSSTTWNYWSLYNNSDISSTQWYTQWLVPADGQITNCAVSIQSNRSAEFGVYKNQGIGTSIGAVTPTYTQSLSGGGSNALYTFVLTANSFTKGDRIGFAMKSDGTGTLSYCNFNIVYEFS